MVNPGSFADLYKPISKVFSGYSTNKFDVNVKGKTYGLNYGVSTSRDTESAATSAELALTRETKVNGTSVSVTSSYSVDGKVNVKVNAAEVHPGVRLGAAAQLFVDPSKPQNATLSAEYKHELGTVTSDLKYTPGKLNLAGSALVASNGLAVGVDGNGNLLSKTCECWNLGLSYTASNFVVASLLNKKLSEAQIGVAHQASPSLAFAGELKQSLTTKGPATLTFGSAYTIDATSRIRAKFNSKGVAAVNYGHDISKTTSVNVTAEVDTATLTAAPTTRLGFGVNFSL